MSEVLSRERSAWYRSPWRCEHPYAVSKHVTVRCRRRDCRGCGRWWTKDQRDKIFKNLAAYEGHTALVTVTAPGKDVLPWDESGERCLAGPLGVWNYLAPKKWRSLHRVASKRARRAAEGQRWCVLVKVWQEQRRGALHVHLVVPMASEAERAGSAAYVAALHENAKAYGFGFVDRKLELRSPAKSAGYVARYVASELAMCRNLPGHVVDVARLLTSRTGVTVRRLRAERCRFAQAAARDLTAPSPPDLEQLALELLVRRAAGARRASAHARRRAPPGGASILALTAVEWRRLWEEVRSRGESGSL